jgi:ABC-2 type transport system ATP-binding protein
LILANISGGADRQRAADVMRRVGLDPADKKPVGKYSLGMRQRLGIAQAIMEDPEILIFDEPFNGLDKSAMVEIRGLFQDLKAKGKLIILVSHYAQEIMDNCDIVYEIENGKLVLQGDARPEPAAM